MINFNGEILSNEIILNNNRGFLYSDAVFETVKIVNDKILFSEEHYFRLMAAMRIVRMEIPMNFTLEFFEEQILALAKNNNCSNTARARITVYRNDGGFYLPENNTVSYLIKVSPISNPLYSFENKNYEVDLYKDFYITKQLLSTIKSTNKQINVLASIFAKENDLANCLLLNDQKNVIEATNGNLFMLTGNQLITPTISDGCLNGIMRKQIIELVQKMEQYEVLQQSISPFDLQKADELFITNVVIGIQPITKYRKKVFGTDLSNQLICKLNDLVKSN